MGAVNTSRAKSLMSLHKNLCMKAVLRSSRSLSVIDRNIDFDEFLWPSNITRPKIVAENENIIVLKLAINIRFM